MFLKKNNFFLVFFLINLYFTKNDVFASQVLINIDKNDYSLIVERAFTEMEKQRGLMFIKELKNTNGMLFIYEKPKIVRMWMKNTNLNLDVIFINKRNLITSVKKGLSLSEEIISSDVPVIAVLEIPSSCNKKIKLKKGDKIKWKKLDSHTKISSNLFPCII